MTAQIRNAILSETENGRIPAYLPRKREAWEKDIRRIYTTSADGVLALQQKLGWYEADEEASKALAAKWERIREILKIAPREAEARQLVEAIGLSMQEFKTMYGKAWIDDAILYAKDLKDRYSVLWLWYEYFRSEPWL